MTHSTITAGASASLRRSVLVVAMLSALGASTSGLAQDSDAEASMLEEVIVTAQRREQTLQEVPIAISAFNAQDLANLQANTLDSLQGAVPNLNIVKGRGSNSSANVFIRGVGQPDALQTFDPAVGIYVDDVYMSRIQGSLFKLYDIERVEVLRGPQGTLYGKNTPGGAIRLITRTPGQEMEASAGLTFGDYSRFQASGYLSGPLSDNFAMSLTLLHDERDGFVTDPSDGRKYNDADTNVGRVKAKWDVNDDVSVIFSADYNSEDVQLTLGQSQAALFSFDLATGGVTLLTLPPTGEWGFSTQTSLGNAGGQKLDHYGGSVTVNWDINSQLSFKSITAYRDLTADLYVDIDATQYELGDVFVGIDQDQFSQEFQFLGDNDNGVNWVAGLYYINESIPSHQEAYADDFLTFNGFPISFLRTIDDDLETTSYAAFGQVDIAIADVWTLGLGLRYTKDKKDYTRSTSTFSDLLGNADPAFAFSESDSWDDWTPTISLDYALNDNVNLYGRLANGYKSGGFNGRANLPADESTFDPESVWTAELGAKTVMADGRFQANYAVFSSKYEDFQARVSVGDGLDISLPVLNAAELDIWGAEAEFTWLPIDPLQLSAQVGYLDSEYGGEGFAGSDFVLDEPAFSPEWTARFAAIWTAGLGGGHNLTFGADADYRDFMWLGVDNIAGLSQDDYWLFNGFIRWDRDGGNWSVTGGIKNATDEEYKVEGQEFRSVGGIVTAYYGNPRTWTLELEYRY